MKNKKIIYIIYPNSFESVSINNLAMSELLLNELILSRNKRIKFSVNNKMRLIECNDSSVKRVLDLIMKAGKLPDVKRQLLELIHKGAFSEDILGKFKFSIDDEQTDLLIKEIKFGLDFAWEVMRL